MPLDDTIVALSSGRPPAAVAIIRTSGPQAKAAAEAVAGPLPSPRQASLRTLRDPRTGGSDLDSAILLCFDAPYSATGEDIVEYQCHGGRAVVAAIIDALTSLGLRQAEPGEFTRRALANGRIDLTEAEGLADLLEAETESQRRAAFALAGGALSRQVEAWQSRILDLSARAEAAIDYVGDEDETATDTRFLHEDALALAAEFDQWLARPRAERLKDGIRVVVAGPPNAGKSSLVNALAGSDRAIVTDIPGTTRDAIEVPLAIDGIPVLLVDTAGLRETVDPVEAIGVARSHSETERAEILVWLGDPQGAPAHANRLVVHSKSDLGTLDPIIVLNVSAVTGAGIPQLLGMLGNAARALLPADGEVPLNHRQAGSIAQTAALLRCCPTELLLLAETLRAVRSVFDRLTGRAGVEDAIDALFTRFCLGK